MNFIMPIFIFFTLIKYIIFADIILSWLQIFWLKMRPQFLAGIIDPMYESIKKYIPTTIWPIDFTPIVILILISFILWFVEIFFPGSHSTFNSYFQ